MAEETSRLADIEALTGGVRWRWGMICGGAVLMALGRTLELSALTPWLPVYFVAVGGFANLTLVRLLRLNWYRWWLTYAYCLTDVSLVALAIVYLGPGGTIAGFFFVVLPCAFRPNRALVLFALSAASVAFLIAAALHRLLSGAPDSNMLGLPPSVLLDLVLFVAVAATLMVARTDLFGRIAVVRAAIKEATEGSFTRQTHAKRNDLLGQLDQLLNAMLEEVASTIEVVQREAEEVAVLAGFFAQSASSAGESSRQVVLMATGLAQELGDLQSVAEAGHTESTDAAQEARSLQSRAEGEADDALAFEAAVQTGRDHVARTSESVVAIGADISRATNIVTELGGLSRQIGSSALSIAKVARHTHVLALNAAIEAARAEEHGKEFAVVADQVRTLAGEAGRSARDVADLIGEVQAGIAAAENALVAGEGKAADIGVMVNEVRTTMTELKSRASNAAALVSATAEISQSQAKRAGSLASMMSQFAANSTRWSADVNETTDAMSAQITTLKNLDETNRRLEDLGERLRDSTARYSRRQTE